MAKLLILSRSHDRWVRWHMEQTEFDAETPAHEVLMRVALEHPEMMVAIASRGRARGRAAAAAAAELSQFTLPEFPAS